jgi:hypothetical protein
MGFGEEGGEENPGARMSNTEFSEVHVPSVNNRYILLSIQYMIIVVL